MEDTKKSWFSENRWVVSLALGILVFVGLALPMLKAKPVHFDPTNWFSHDSRTNIGAGMLFGLEGAVNWVYLILYGMTLIGVALLPIGYLVKKTDTFASASMILFLVAGVLFFISASSYGLTNALATVDQYPDVDRYSYLQGYVEEADARLGVGVMLSGALCVLSSLSCFSFSMAKQRLDIRSMTEIAMLCAASIVLDVIFHFIPNAAGQVGSFSVALVPLYIVALRHGPARGFLAGSIIYGLITCLTDGYGLWLYPLDYFVAYSGVAVLGFFSRWILANGQKNYNFRGIIFLIVGCLLGGVVRFIGSSASSMVNYGYAIGPAMLCNIYCLASGLLCGIVLAALYGPLLRLNQRFPVRKAE